jgi:ELWxxDGT repeat protein
VLGGQSLVVGGLLYFAANDGVHGFEPWRTDGTPAGTFLLGDLEPGPASSNLSFDKFGAVGGTLFFGDKTSLVGDGGLWRTNGTPAGTALVKVVKVEKFLGSIQGKLIFSHDHTDGVELWVSDGTTAGTTPLKVFSYSPDLEGLSTPHTALVSGMLVFRAADGAHGLELWKTDGTPAGTGLVKDIWPGTASSLPQSDIIDHLDPGRLHSVNSVLLFPADDGVHGVELWKSDGTAAGTTLVKDLWPGAGSANPRAINVASDTLLFTADDGPDSSALWRSDGAAAGTTRVQALLPGAIAQEPTLAGEQLFFSTDDGLHGYELWALPTSAQAHLTFSAPAQVAAAPGSLVAIPIDYRNAGQAPAASTTLVATLDPATTYAGDNSGLQPTVSGNSITWVLPRLGFLEAHDMWLLLRVPKAPLGTPYPLTLRLGVGASLQTIAVEITIVDMNYLPLVRS